MVKKNSDAKAIKLSVMMVAFIWQRTWMCDYRYSGIRLPSSCRLESPCKRISEKCLDYWKKNLSIVKMFEFFGGLVLPPRVLWTETLSLCP